MRVRSARLGFLCFLILLLGCTAYQRRETLIVLDLHPLAMERKLIAELSDFDKKRAQDIDKELLKELKETKDPEAQARVNEIIARLVPKIYKRELHPIVRVIESEQVNAFVTGGEYIYVFSQLLKEVQSDDELAGILAHELSHVDAGHISRSALPSFLARVALIGGALSKNEHVETVATVAAVASFTGYSREHEREADILGALCAYRAGYDPERLTDFFERSLKQEETRLKELETAVEKAKSEMDRACGSASAEGGEVSESCRVAREKYQETQKAHDSFVVLRMPIFRTHPVNQQRIQVVKEVSQHLKGERPLEAISTDAPTVKKVFGVLDRVEDQKVAVSFLSRGKELEGQGEWGAAEESYRQALEIFPQYADALSARADLLVRRGDLAQAEADYKKAIEWDLGLWEAYRGLGNLYAQQGRFKEAVPLLREAAIRLKEPESFEALEKCYEALGNTRAAKWAFRQAQMLRARQ